MTRNGRDRGTKPFTMASNGKLMSFHRFALITLLLVSVFLASCNGGAIPDPPSATVFPTETETQTPLPTLTRTATLTPTVTLTLTPTPTPDLRLPPEKWKEWPVVPEISPYAAQIYLNGLAQSNDPHAFSKVGDCQSVPASFLGLFDRPGYYFLSPEYQFLQETIDFYKGSFGRESQAVRGGFNAASVLLPMWADPKACARGETPIECENRLHNPSIVFISLEVWFKGRTPEVLEGYLRQIIEYYISQNVLPILATKADNVEGDYSINATVAKLSYEYDIPLWNFWRAVQPLPNHGIDWSRDTTGFHITVEAWNVRSFSALQTLDSIHRSVQAMASQSAAGGTMTPSATPDASAPLVVESAPGIPGVTIQPAAQGTGEAALMFDLASRSLNNTTALGIFSGDLNGSNWHALTGESTHLQTFSPDGRQALVSRGTQLFSLDLARRQATLLREDLYPYSPQGAYRLSSGEVVYIQQDGAETYMVILKASGETMRLTAAGVHPVELYPSAYDDRVYWGAGTCNASACAATDTALTTVNDSVTQTLPGVVRPVISGNGTLAYVTSDKRSNILILVADGQTSNISIPGNRVMDLAWSPDGGTLAVSAVTSSNYSGRLLENYFVLVRWPDVVAQVNLPGEGFTEKLAWSLDGGSLLLVRRTYTAEGYRLNFSRLDAASRLFDGQSGFDLLSQAYLSLAHLFWISAVPVTPADSGIEGQVFIGPMCPVVQFGPPRAEPLG